jgi:mRNA interferase MazF
MMSIRKGEIYLANLGKKNQNDIGKIRPVVIFQNNFLNMMVDELLYQDVIVLPLSSKIVQSEYSYLIKARESLRKDSAILCNAIKMISSDRIYHQDGVLTTLSDGEIVDIEKILYNLLGCGL